jgi:nucleotide-binding universal stress UspA family protein
LPRARHGSQTGFGSKHHGGKFNRGKTMFKHILIPTDGSSLAGKAVEKGIALAASIGARVTGYCALHDTALIAGEGYVIGSDLTAEFDKRARETADAHVAEIAAAAAAAGVAFEALVTKPPSPYEGIIGAAKKQKCDLIAMASHGRRGLAGVIIGSVTQSVLTHSKIPVLVFR